MLQVGAVQVEEQCRGTAVQVELQAEISWKFRLKSGEGNSGWNQVGVSAEIRWLFSWNHSACKRRWRSSSGGWTGAVQAEISAGGRGSGWGQGSWFQVAGSGCAGSNWGAAAQPLTKGCRELTFFKIWTLLNNRKSYSYHLTDSKSIFPSTDKSTHKKPIILTSHFCNQ